MKVKWDKKTHRGPKLSFRIKKKKKLKTNNNQKNEKNKK